MVKIDLFHGNRDHRCLFYTVLDSRGNVWMKALAVMLMAFMFIIAFFARFQPFPFFGFILGQMIYPFSARISWKELFEIYLSYYIIITLISNPQGLLSLPTLWSSMMPEEYVFMAPLSPMIYLLMLPLAALLNSTALHFLGSHIHPKMIRRLGL